MIVQRARWAAAFVRTFAWIALGVSSGHACSCHVPDLGFLAGQKIEVPGNARGLLWAGVLNQRGVIVFPAASSFRIEKKTDDSWESVTPEFSLIDRSSGIAQAGSTSPYDVLLVKPASGMAAGDRFRFVYYPPVAAVGQPSLAEAEFDSQVVNVVVSGEVFETAAPRRLSVAVEKGTLELATRCGSCSVDVDAQWLAVDDLLDPADDRWRDSLFYTTVIVTRPGRRLWQPTASLCQFVPPGRSWVGAGRERFYWIESPGHCDALETGLDAETVEAYVDIWLPGREIGQTVQIDLTMERN